MTFHFKCECGATLLAMCKTPEDVPAILKANDWESRPKNGITYRAWTDTVPALCPECKTKILTGKNI